MYDGGLFTCPGFPDFTIRDCDPLNTVLNNVFTHLCSVLSTASFTNQNIGSGEGVFAQQNGVFQEFKSITGGQGVDVTSTATEINIGLDFTSTGGTLAITPGVGNSLNFETVGPPGETNTASNLGGGEGGLVRADRFERRQGDHRDLRGPAVRHRR